MGRREAKKIYISGPISGRPMEEVKKQFEERAQVIRDMGMEPVSPLEVSPHEEGKSWGEHMMADLEALMNCDGYTMLAGWHNSPGAYIERIFANRMDLVEIEI